MEKKKFSEGMAVLCEQFQREASELLLRGYWIVLQNLTNEQFEKAVLQVLSTKTFNKMPLPAELLEAVHGNLDDKAVLAISKIELAWRKGVGAYHNVCFDDPLIHVLIDRSGGWEKLCAIPEHDWKFFKKDLERQYKAMSGIHHAHLGDIPPVLFGAHGGYENIKKLEQIDRPVEIEYIGDRQAAIEWTRQIGQARRMNPDILQLTSVVKAL